jgi:hypothetical protein
MNLAVVKGSFGCPGCDNHFELVDLDVDTRGDGMTYSGVYASIHPGEDPQQVLKQVRQDYASVFRCRQDRSE